MTVPAQHAYPAAATNKTWQAKKSTGDKILTSTGLGPKLTDAEAKWKLIKWDDMDLSKQTVSTVAGAEAALRKAETAHHIVETTVDKALRDAAAEAQVAVHNKKLSSTTQKAAQAAYDALIDAKDILDKISLQEFHLKVAALTQPIKVANIVVYSARTVVARADSAAWDRAAKKLTTRGMKWEKGQAATAYAGKVLTVSGQVEGNRDAEGISKVFKNDMKLDGGHTDVFVNAH